MSNTTEPNVATPSLAHQAMEPEWYKTSTVLAGTQSMRDSGQEMTPQHEHESQTSYDERVACNVLFNVTDLTLRTWVGKPFAASVQYTEDFSELLVPYMEDIDLQGNNLDVFARDVFSHGVSHALTHVLVDHPRVEWFPGRTKKDDLEENVRPYCVHIKAEDLIFAESMRINGKETLTHVRIKELHTYRVEWEEMIEERVKVLDLVTLYEDEVTGEPLAEPVTLVRVTIWRWDTGEEKWIEGEHWYMDIDVIPLVTFYADRTGFMTGKSPLLDLVDLNIRHWQSFSDQIAILTVARFPMLACSGGDDEDEGNKLVVGPKEWLFASDPSAKFYYVEHRGAAIKAGEEDLMRLEERMKSYGAEFMKKSPDRQTASARNLDSSEATSPLQDVVYRFNDALTQIMWLMAYWQRFELEGTAFLPTNFTSPEASTLQVLAETWKEGGISDKAYLHELQRYSVLDEHFDFEKNQKQLKAQADADAKAANVDANADEDNASRDGDNE